MRPTPIAAALAALFALGACGGGDGSGGSTDALRGQCISACAEEAAAESIPHLPYLCGPLLDGCSCVASGEMPCEVEFAFPDAPTG